MTASFSHISLVHLGFNMISTWQLKAAETLLGALGYLRMTFIFLIFSILFQQGMHFALIHTRWGEQTRGTVGLGYSCVVFAWMTWLSLSTQASSYLDFIFFRVPYSMSPFFSLIFTQILIPKVDFVGHLSGILVGYWQGWGLNTWLTDYWLLQLAVWVLLALLASRHASSRQVFLTLAPEHMHLVGGSLSRKVTYSCFRLHLRAGTNRAGGASRTAGGFLMFQARDPGRRYRRVAAPMLFFQS